MSNTSSTSSSSSSNVICHYEILNVPRDADAALIKQQYRKLALKYHPDKNLNDTSEQTQTQFRLVQQAYECLSDPAERKWYDEHRDAILQGWTTSQNNNNNNSATNANADEVVSLVVNVIPYLYAGCYNGYTDREGDFFAVYRKAFQSIYQNEQQAWINQGQLDDLPWIRHTNAVVDFGTSHSEWNHVAAFYQTWHGFSSCWNFAWADEYHYHGLQDGDVDRRLRRAMDDHNQKRRKAAKKEYHATIMALLQFCQRRDPRVQAHDRQVQQEKQQRHEQQQAEMRRKRLETQQAREVWKVQAAKELAQMEEEDRLAGRVRLADLDDDDDDDYDYQHNTKKKRGGRRGKKNKKKQNNGNFNGNDDDIEKVDDNLDQDGSNNEQPLSQNIQEENEMKMKNPTNDTAALAQTMETPAVLNTRAEPKAVNETQKTLDVVTDSDHDHHQGSTSETRQSSTGTHVGADVSSLVDSEEDESIVDVWRCECCRKDFKSQGQLENHMKSKKHKEAFKKYQSKLKKSEQEMMDELLDELVIG